MIYQITPVKTQTEPLPKINRGLMQTRHLQAQLKERIADGILPDPSESWSPITPGPYLVPVSRWIE
jgi:hypothetical protein